MNDFLRSLGPLGMSLRFRRLSDRLTDEGLRLAATYKVPLAPHWYAILLLLHTRGPHSVVAVAGALGIAHPSVIALCRRMEAKGLLTSSQDPTDRRKRLLELSPMAREQIGSYQPTWDAINRAVDRLIDGAGGGVLPALDDLEDQLERSPLDERVLHVVAARSHPRPPADAPPLSVRPIGEGDREEVLSIARELVRTGESYAFDPAIGDDALWGYWSPAAPQRGYVAVSGGEVVGAFVIRPNHPGPGAHVANASYAVRADRRGLGVGLRMGRRSLELARSQGYLAMQFNLVVDTNRAALALWKQLGFRVRGTIPDGFRLPDGRLVPFHILHRTL